MCVNGTCFCRRGWDGPNCDVQHCPGGCNGHGVCNGVGCVCDKGVGGRAVRRGGVRRRLPRESPLRRRRVRVRPRAHRRRRRRVLAPHVPRRLQRQRRVQRRHVRLLRRLVEGLMRRARVPVGGAIARRGSRCRARGTASAAPTASACAPTGGATAAGARARTAARGRGTATSRGSASARPAGSAPTAGCRRASASAPATAAASSRRRGGSARPRRAGALRVRAGVARRRLRAAGVPGVVLRRHGRRHVAVWRRRVLGPRRARRRRRVHRAAAGGRRRLLEGGVPRRLRRPRLVRRDEARELEVRVRRRVNSGDDCGVATCADDCGGAGQCYDGTCLCYPGAEGADGTCNPLTQHGAVSLRCTNQCIEGCDKRCGATATQPPAECFRSASTAASACARSRAENGEPGGPPGTDERALRGVGLGFRVHFVNKSRWRQNRSQRLARAHPLAERRAAVRRALAGRLLQCRRRHVAEKFFATRRAPSALAPTRADVAGKDLELLERCERASADSAEQPTRVGARRLTTKKTSSALEVTCSLARDARAPRAGGTADRAAALRADAPRGRLRHRRASGDRAGGRAQPADARARRRAAVGAAAGRERRRALVQPDRRGASDARLGGALPSLDAEFEGVRALLLPAVAHRVGSAATLGAAGRTPPSPSSTATFCSFAARRARLAQLAAAPAHARSQTKGDDRRVSAPLARHAASLCRFSAQFVRDADAQARRCARPLRRQPRRSPA